MWDEEVDVVCFGGAVGALASAVVADDAGAEVFVAVATPAVPDDPAAVPAPSLRERGWLSDPPPDEETAEYYAELSKDLAPVDPAATDTDVPTRVVRELTRSERESRYVEPFFGGRLRAWSTRCLRSPYGLMHSRVADWQTTTMRTLDGSAFEVKQVASAEASDVGAASLLDWLSELADERDIPVNRGTALQRIVFEEGEVVGVVLDTADGPFAVRARHGVTIAPEDHHAATAGNRPLGRSEGRLHLCLVSREASRFARLELLNTAAEIPQRPVACYSANRALPQTMHEVRHTRSDARRGRKADRNPPFGQ